MAPSSSLSWPTHLRAAGGWGAVVAGVLLVAAVAWTGRESSTSPFGSTALGDLALVMAAAGMLLLLEREPRRAGWWLLLPVAAAASAWLLTTPPGWDVGRGTNELRDATPLRPLASPAVAFSIGLIAAAAAVRSVWRRAGWTLLMLVSVASGPVVLGVLALLANAAASTPPPTLETAGHQLPVWSALALVSLGGLIWTVGWRDAVARTGLRSFLPWRVASLHRSRGWARGTQSAASPALAADALSDSSLRLALDESPLGVFEWTVGSGVFLCNAGWWQQLGYAPPGPFATFAEWCTLLHPEDEPRFSRQLQSQLRGQTSVSRLEVRLRDGAGSWRPVEWRARSVGNQPQRCPPRLVGTLRDLTEEQKREEALREQQAISRRLAFVASRTEHLVLLCSAHGTVEWVNASFSTVLEYALEEIQGRNPIELLLGSGTSPWTTRRIAAALRRRTGLECDLAVRSKSGRAHPCRLHLQPLLSEAEELEGFIALLVDVTPRVEAEATLRLAQAEAEDMSRAKSAFLASMSHEIRTPMNGVIGMTTLLLETGLDLEQRDYVNTIRTSSEALLGIINDILDFSKIESGRLELERHAFDVAAGVEEVLEVFALPAAAKRLELAYHVADDVPSSVIGDVRRLRQILSKLVDNAIKFTPSGAITLTVRRCPVPPPAAATSTALGLEISVTDTGIGIPRDRQEVIFQPFAQVDSSMSRSFGGTGLGLAICQRLVQLMQGTIRVESSPGAGASFSFTLSVEAAAPTRPLLPPVVWPGHFVLGLEDQAVTQARLGSLFERWDIRYHATTSPAEARELLLQPRSPALVLIDYELLSAPNGAAVAAILRERDLPTIYLLPPGQTLPASVPAQERMRALPKPLKTATLVHAVQALLAPGEGGASRDLAPAGLRTLADERPLQVLLVEDNVVNQKVALRFLSRLGYGAQVVGNGLEAVQAVQAHAFDLVLMDLQMPELDGFEASRRIRRELPAARQPKIVALTANALHGDRELCLKAGMDDYITKPVRLSDLEHVIRRQFNLLVT